MLSSREWRAKAEEVRTIAEEMRDPDCRGKLEDVAIRFYEEPRSGGAIYSHLVTSNGYRRLHKSDAD
jgi:hypothetical protein